MSYWLESCTWASWLEMRALQMLPRAGIVRRLSSLRHDSSRLHIIYERAQLTAGSNPFV